MNLLDMETEARPDGGLIFRLLLDEPILPEEAVVLMSPGTPVFSKLVEAGILSPGGTVLRRLHLERSGKNHPGGFLVTISVEVTG